MEDAEVIGLFRNDYLVAAGFGGSGMADHGAEMIGSFWHLSRLCQHSSVFSLKATGPKKRRFKWKYFLISDFLLLIPLTFLR